MNVHKVRDKIRKKVTVFENRAKISNRSISTRITAQRLAQILKKEFSGLIPLTPILPLYQV